MAKKAVVLLSGGLDSSTVLFFERSRGYGTHALIFDYGQRHAKEVNNAKKIARLAGSMFTVLKINLPWGESTLLEGAGELPERPLEKITGEKIPSTYVPGRNTIFISYAVSLADTIGADRIFLGANAVDYSGYPDCRPGYIEAWNRLLHTLCPLYGKKPVKIEAPLIKKTKADIVELGYELKVPFELTWSCYAGGARPCMKCDSCRLRKKGFKEAGFEDPLEAFGKK
jgi:7-cyano-7-deazaguanine synthase